MPLKPAKLVYYVKTIESKSVPISTVSGFIDGIQYVSFDSFACTFPGLVWIFVIAYRDEGCVLNINFKDKIQNTWM